MRKYLGGDVIRAWANATQESGYKDSRKNLFFRGPIIYSYGEHFPLGIRLTDAGGALRGFVLNADTVSRTTSGHQSDVRAAASARHVPRLLVPFSALRAAGVVAADIQIIDVEGDREIEVGVRHRRVWSQSGRQLDSHGRRYDLEAYQAYRHLLGRAVFAARGRYFLSGIDETARDLWRGYFLAELPQPVSTVNEALEGLKPSEVRQAETDGREVRRQGEFFFVPGPRVLRKAGYRIQDGYPTTLLPHKRAGRRERHSATKLRVKDGQLYARGTVKHLGREHRVLSLKGWYAVYENTEVASFRAGGAFGRID